MLLPVVDGVGGKFAICRQWMGHLWALTAAHSLHQLVAFANIQGAILALHLAQETIVDEGGCLSWWGGTYCWPMPCRRNGWFGGHRPPHSTVVGSVILWGDFLDFRNCQKKALTHPNQGFSFGAGEMNRTPDLLITNEMKGVFVRVDCC